MNAKMTLTTLAGTLTALAAPAAAQLDIDWFSIDGGGIMNSTGPGGLELSSTLGQHDAGPMTLTGGGFELLGGFWGVAGTPPLVLVDITSANPPTDNPFVAGQQPFRDVLQTGTSLTTVTQGIGAAGTPAQNTVTYATLSITFSGTPSPAPSTGNITVACNGTGPYPCPSVSSVAGSGAGPYTISLSGAIPPRNCTTLTFAGTNAGQKLQYQSLPGDVGLNGSASAADLAQLVAAINVGAPPPASLAANLPRYNINRISSVSATDVNRLVQLLNGVNTTQPWTGAGVAACP